jgi:hypothetical protein
MVFPNQYSCESSGIYNHIPEYFTYKTKFKKVAFVSKVTVEKSQKSIYKGKIGLEVHYFFSEDKINYIETRTTYLAQKFTSYEGGSLC